MAAHPKTEPRRRPARVEVPAPKMPVTYVAGRDPTTAAREHAARLVAERYPRRTRDRR